MTMRLLRTSIPHIYRLSKHIGSIWNPNHDLERRYGKSSKAKEKGRENCLKFATFGMASRTALGHDNLPYCYYEHNGWKIVFYAIPRPLDSQGQANKTVVYQLSEARKVEAENSLRDALETKSKKYGNFELPYVIAVDVLAIDSFGTDIGEILFGKEVILFDRQLEDFSLTRSPLLPDRPSEENGFCRARKRARNQQVSALLLVEDLMPWSVARKTPVLWHNPWAERPLDPNIWQGPQMIPDMDAPEPYMQERVGKKGHEIFHLQPGGANI